MKKALLVGINYRNTPQELKGCINDVNNMKSFLVKEGYKQITVLTDDSYFKPTQHNILVSLYNLVKGSKPNDTLFFHYSGHGARIPDMDGDEESKLDGSIIPIDFLQNGIIVDDLLRVIFGRLPPNTKVFTLLDCCNSGTSFDLRYLYKDSSFPVKEADKYNYKNWALNQNVQEFKNYPKTSANIVMISASTDEQYAADTYEEGQFCGALTWAFLNTMRETRILKFKHLLKDLNARLKIKGYTQTPELSSGQVLNTEAIFWM